MSSKVQRLLLLLICAVLAIGFVASPKPAPAMPIFAQRYLLKCGVCHSVLPELNAFGNFFRNHGYRLPTTKHGTTLVAIRYQNEYDKDAAPDAPRFVPGGVLLSNADIGKISAYLHYNLGAQGGPSGAYLAYLTRYDETTHMEYRLGLFELPLIHSPGQRLDDLAPYGYETTHVGLNDLTLAQPRWGLDAERQVGNARLMGTLAVGEFKGAAYGGRPIDTGINTRNDRPEFGLFSRIDVTPWLTLGTDTLIGARAIVPTGRAIFVDNYSRNGLNFGATFKRWWLLGQQYWGQDGDDDGFGTHAFSSGGFLRLRYAIGDHAYAGVRYDAAAAPTAIRDVVLYAATQVGPVRLLIENKRVQSGTSTLEGALTIGFPWPIKK